MYIRETTGKVVSMEERLAVLEFTKMLFRLEIINDAQALNIATQFRILFV